MRSKPQFDYRNRVSSSYNIGHKKSNYILCEITKNVNFMVSMQSDMQGFFKNLFSHAVNFLYPACFKSTRSLFSFPIADRAPCDSCSVREHGGCHFLFVKERIYPFADRHCSSLLYAHIFEFSYITSFFHQIESQNNPGDLRRRPGKFFIVRRTIGASSLFDHKASKSL